MNAVQRILQPCDLLSWGCTGAVELLQDPQSSSATWTYLDGSASPPHFGSAFVDVNNINSHSCKTTASPSPLSLSGGSEFWAVHIKLHSLKSQSPVTALCLVLCDNANVVDCSALAKRSDFNQFHNHPSGHWIKSFCHSINQLLAQGTRVELRWSKAHTGFRGHEIAGAFAKWASLAILLSSLRLPPPPKRSITFQGIPLLGKITQKFYSNILQKHMHNDIKLHESFDWFNFLVLELAVQMVRRHFLHQGSKSALQNAKTPMSCMPSVS